MWTRKLLFLQYMTDMEVCIVFSLVMLNSNCFQNRNSNPKNRLKLETRFLLYPSGMVKRVRISTFDYHSRFGDRRSAHIKRSGNLTCARSDSDSCVARLTDALHSQQLAATVTRARCRKQTGGDWGRSEGRECSWSTNFANLRFLSSVV